MGGSPIAWLGICARVARLHQESLRAGDAPVLLAPSPREAETAAWFAFRAWFKEVETLGNKERRRRFPNLAWIVEEYQARRVGRGRPSLRAWWRRYIRRQSLGGHPGYSAPRGRPSLLWGTATENRELVRAALAEARATYPSREPWSVLAGETGLNPRQLRELVRPV